MDATGQHVLIREMIREGTIACVADPGPARRFFLSGPPSGISPELRADALHGRVGCWFLRIILWATLGGVFVIVIRTLAWPYSWVVGGAIPVVSLGHAIYAARPGAGLWTSLLAVLASQALCVPVGSFALRGAVCLLATSLYLQRLSFYMAETWARTLACVSAEFLRLAELSGIVTLHPLSADSFDVLFEPGSTDPQAKIRERIILAGLIRTGSAEVLCKCGMWATGDRCGACGHPTICLENFDSPYRLGVPA